MKSGDIAPRNGSAMFLPFPDGHLSLLLNASTLFPVNPLASLDVFNSPRETIAARIAGLASSLGPLDGGSVFRM